MKNHFILIKLPGHSSDGQKLSARLSALKLLECEYWPIFKRTRNKKIMKADDEVAIYLGGAYNQMVIATAKIGSIDQWNRAYAKTYPLAMDGIPEVVLKLSEINILKQPVDIIENLDKLSFIPENRQKWGVAFMGGVRRINEIDFHTMTSWQ